jgi:phospholipase/carboxylesterase
MSAEPPDTEGGSGIDALVHRLRPASGDPEGALVLFHGRGTDENDLFSLLDALDPDRRLVGITPRGPLRLPPGGAHWYAVRRIGYPDPDTFRPTFTRLEGWLEAALEDAGVAREDTVIGGFSQGAVMSHALALARGRPQPRVLIAFSGFMPNVDGLELDLGDRRGLAAAIGHGTHDPVIGVEWGREARQRLEAAGARVLYRESPMGHAIDPGFVPEVAALLR